MRIHEFSGIEMEKESKASFQDYFNESYVTFFEQGSAKQFSVVYLRYFEEQLQTYTPFPNNPLLTLNDNEYYLRDCLALIYFLNFPNERHRKRIFISDENEFKRIFEGMDEGKLAEMIGRLVNKDR